MQILEVFQCQKIIESNILKSLKQVNINNIFLEVMAINYYELMINSVNLLSLT